MNTHGTAELQCKILNDVAASVITYRSMFTSRCNSYILFISQHALSLSLPPYSLQTEASGIYCALCVLLRQMEVEGCVDVVNTLQRLREQRPGIFTSQVMKARSREEGRVGRTEGRKEGRGREERRRKRGTGGRGKEVGGGKRLIFTFLYSTTI